MERAHIVKIKSVKIYLAYIMKLQGFEQSLSKKLEMLKIFSKQFLFLFLSEIFQIDNM